MHAVFERCEYWRLRDEKGNPPGLLGWWPSRSVTFLSNHDTVGCLQGWMRGLEAGRLRCMARPPPQKCPTRAVRRTRLRATGASPTTRWSRAMPTS